MDYFRIIHLIKEPFSNSPDPEYFFQSRQHLGCLQKLELALRLRRGLNVVIGEVGTGKATLCRQLIRRFADDRDFETHLILDPYFSNPSEFLAAVAEIFTGTPPPVDANDWQLKEIIKKDIFHKGVDEKKVVILIIDEGQKIPDFCLEILREFLNFETNDYKLLQIAIFAQKEFEETLETYPNFADRINLLHTLGPLSFRDTREMIRFRIKKSSEDPKPPKLFTLPALWAIYRASGGYPRKIINLCHRSIMAVIIQNRTFAGWGLVRSSVKRSSSGKRSKQVRTAFAAGLVVLVSIIVVAFLPGLLKKGADLNPENKSTENRSANLPAEQSFQDKDVPKEPGATAGRSRPSSPGLAATSATEMATTGVPQERGVNLPPLLGQVALKPNETLWRLIEKVYGEYSYSRQKALLKVNPQINDPGRIEAGMAISIPAIPAVIKPPSQTVWWVKLEDKPSLDEAVQALRSYPNGLLPVRMLPYQNPAGEIRVSMLLREYFFNETDARDQLSRLPLEFSEKGETWTGWEKGTVFFADPYLVKK